MKLNKVDPGFQHILGMSIPEGGSIILVPPADVISLTLPGLTSVI